MNVPGVLFDYVHNCRVRILTVETRFRLLATLSLSSWTIIVTVEFLSVELAFWKRIFFNRYFRFWSDYYRRFLLGTLILNRFCKRSIFLHHLIEFLYRSVAWFYYELIFATGIDIPNFYSMRIPEWFSITFKICVSIIIHVQNSNNAIGSWQILWSNKRMWFVLIVLSLPGLYLCRIDIRCINKKPSRFSNSMI